MGCHVERLWQRLASGFAGLGRGEEGPWLLLVATAACAPFVVLGQGGDLHTAVLAGLACLATPGLAIEMMLGMARLGLALAPPDRR